LPSFKLNANKLNEMIAKRLEETERYVDVRLEAGTIHVEFQYGLTISRLTLGEIAKELSDRDWRNLAKEIKSTLVGAKVRELNDQTIGIQPIRTEWIHVRVNPIEKALIADAAKARGKTIADFVRIAALKVAEEVFQEEVRKEEMERKEETEKSYVA